MGVNGSGGDLAMTDFVAVQWPRLVRSTPVQEVRGEAYRPGEVQFVHGPGSGGRRGMVGEGDSGP